MQKLLTYMIALASLGLAACSVHQVPVQQGNVLTEDLVERIEPGMTREEITFILGTPPIRDPFHPHRWDYVYSYRRGKEYEQRRITLHFEGDRLARMEGDVEAEGLLAPESDITGVPDRAAPEAPNPQEDRPAPAPEGPSPAPVPGPGP